MLAAVVMVFGSLGVALNLFGFGLGIEAVAVTANAHMSTETGAEQALFPERSVTFDQALVRTMHNSEKLRNQPDG